MRKASVVLDVMMPEYEFNTVQVGHTVVATASSRDSEHQKKLGATEVVDYKATDVVKRLRALGPSEYLFTASGDAASHQALTSLLQPGEGRFARVLGGQVDLPLYLWHTAFP